MNAPQQYILAIIFTGVLALVGAGVYVYQSYLAPVSTESTSSAPRDFFSSLFPFSDATPEGVLSGAQEGSTGEPPALRQITDKLVAGATFVTTPNGTVLRYTESETGHIYEASITTYNSVRLTNTTLPGALDALWVSSTTVLYRFMTENGSVDNYLAKIASSSPDQTLFGETIPKYQRVRAEDGTLIGVMETGTGSTIQTFTKGKATTIAQSPLRSWVPVSASLAYSAPSSGVPGHLVSISKGRLVPLESGVGMEVLANPTGRLLVSGGGRTISLSIGEVGNMTPAEVATIVDKCTWAGVLALCAVPSTVPSGAYPNDWLLGRVHTADNLWFINSRGEAKSAAVFTEQNRSFDVSKLVVSDDLSAAAFIDRTDGTLWVTALLVP